TRDSIAHDGDRAPVSIAATVARATPALAASASCVSPAAYRARFTNPPTSTVAPLTSVAPAVPVIPPPSPSPRPRCPRRRAHAVASRRLRHPWSRIDPLRAGRGPRPVDNPAVLRNGSELDPTETPVSVTHDIRDTHRGRPRPGPDAVSRRCRRCATDPGGSRSPTPGLRHPTGRPR